MFKLIFYAALVSAFLATVSCEDAASSSQTESYEDDDRENENAASSSQTESCEDGDGENEKLCPEYEVYSECPRVKCEYEYCPKSRDDPLQCPYGKACDPPRCVCMNNRHRDRRTKKCILTQSCPPFKCSGPNEEFNSCPPSCPSEKCSDFISNKTCGPPLGTRIGVVVPCQPQCRCKKGFYRNNDNVCVKAKDCPPECPKYEVYSTCIQGECRALNCSQLGESIPCPRVDPKYCKKGCICAEGYVRDKKGKCIPKDTCPEGCGGDPNAQTGCSNYCGHSCSDYDKPVPCPFFCIVNGCSCKKGFVYNPNVKKCVLPKDCTQECPKNEVYSTCIQGQCRPKTCSQRGKPIACPKIDPKYCKKGCLCVEGYLRNENGKCIPQDKCPSDEGCGGVPNAVKTNCGSYCGNSCSDYNSTDVVCPAVCNLDGCACKKNYVYDPNVKKCVLPKDCSLQCTGPNEVYDPCAPTCPPQNCTTVGVQFSCIEQPAPGDPRCKEGCRCKPGFYRDFRNVCVSKSDCLKCTKPNEVFDSCSQSCPPNTCKDIGKVFKCPRQPVPGDPECVRECRCKKDFYKNSKGECVSKSDCYKIECHRPHEESKYVYDCPPEITCKTIGIQFKCRRTDDMKPKQKCVCEKNYYRNEIGECVTQKQCEKCPGKNEYSSCGGACDNVCATLDTQNQTWCPIINVKCNEMCYCVEGTARDENNNCVPIAECKKSPSWSNKSNT